MRFSFLKIDISSNKVKRLLMLGCMVCFLLVVGVLSIKRIVREFASSIVTTGSLASWGIGIQGSSVKYADLKVSFFSPQVVITGLVVETPHVSLEIDGLMFSYGLFSKNSTVQFSEGYIHVLAGDRETGERLKCRVGSGLDIKWKDSTALYFLKRILFGKRITNGVVQVSYADDVGAHCTNNLGGEENVASAYERLRISLSFSEGDALKADAVMRLKAKEGVGSLLLNMSDVMVQKSHDDGATKINIPSLGLEGNSFAVKLNGNMLISQKCALMSFRRCIYNINLEVRGFDELYSFIKTGVSGLLTEYMGVPSSEGVEHLFGFWNAIFDVIRASAKFSDGEDIARITLNSTEKEGLVISGIPLNKIRDDIVKRLRSMQGYDSLVGH